MASLYELNVKLAVYEMEFDENGEWINENELEAIHMERDEKIENICLWIKNLEAEKAAVRAEKQNFDEREKKLGNKIDRLKSYVASSLDGKEFKTSKVVCKFRKSESVKILDESKIPEEFLKISVVREPLKKEIKKYLKDIEGSDEECEWAKIDKKNNLSVK